LCSRRVRTDARLALVAAGLILVAAAAGAAVPEFAGDRAMAWVEAQCDLGPRPPGSAALEQLRTVILAHADSLGLVARRLPFTARVPLTGETVTAANLVVSAGPAGGERLWLGAHYDTRPVADHDPDPERRGEPILGANDGGSGTAVLLHLMELLAAAPPPRGVDLLFFDLEDAGRAGDPASYCLGSQRLAAGWDQFGSPLAGGIPQGLVLLDMVGQKDLRIAQEAYSLRYAPELTQAVFARAAALGLDVFVPEPGRAVYDDHVPFLQAGIPAVDLIDFDYPQWHTTEDTPAACSPASLAAVGRLVTDLCYRPLESF